MTIPSSSFLRVPALACAVLLTASTVSLAVPMQLTSDPYNSAVLPSWDPGSNLISFRTKRQTNNPSSPNVGGVEWTPTGGINERSLATGVNSPLGVANGPSSWVGSSGRLVINEMLGLHEYLSFVPDRVAPLTAPFRNFSTGSTGGFTSELIVDGGGGGGFMEVSRDGSTALWRFSNSGGGGFQQIRTAPFASLSGGLASSFGTQVASLGSTSTQLFLQGAALTPTGDQFILSERSGAGFDLFRYDINGSNRTRLTGTGTTLGAFNGSPEVSPDGTRIAFQRNSGAATTSGISTINLDGGGLLDVTNNGGVGAAHPTWSPNGSQIAFTSGGQIWSDQVFGGNPNAPPPVFPPATPPGPGGLSFQLDAGTIFSTGNATVPNNYTPTSLGGTHRLSVTALGAQANLLTDRASNTARQQFTFLRSDGFTDPADVWIHAPLNGTMIAADNGRVTANANLQLFDMNGILIDVAGSGLIQLQAPFATPPFTVAERRDVSELFSLRATLIPGQVYNLASTLDLFAFGGGPSGRGDGFFDQSFKFALSGSPDNPFADVAAVPEPSSVVLMLAGLALVAGQRRRSSRDNF